MTKEAYLATAWKYLELEWPEKVAALLQLIADRQVKTATIDIILLNCRRKNYSVSTAAGRLANFTSNKVEKGG
jgi:hypothetical protein